MKQAGYWIAVLTVFSFGASTWAAWQPAKGPLATRWAKDVSPENAHPEYPRPQMVRQEWLNLNGLWDYAIRPKEEARPEKFDGEILAPFPIESALSGVMKRVGENNRLWYRRGFELPTSWSGRRVLLHFEAVDWETTVLVNGRELGKHRGGYARFSFDITDALKPSGTQELVVSVWDPTDKSHQARGKQVTEPHSIWYTSTTGIWQTVWVEPLSPQVYIKGLKIVPDVDAGEVRVAVYFSQAMPEVRAIVEVHDGGRAIARAEAASNTEIRLLVPEAKLWSPDSPYLYDLTVTMMKGGEAMDEVTSYFGMRKASLGKDENGVTRIFFNNKPLFMFGPLDQGFWPDGIYTAPTDEALRYDIEATKQLGFNMCRKHVKVEPDRWYYWADRLGLLVWQDMPSGDRFARSGQGEITRSKESAEQFEQELTALVETHFNHPCIVMWVPFNEGWGQYDTARIVEKIKALDPTRLVDCASGWNDMGVGDVHDIHSYPGPAAVPPEPNRAAVLGEFGGLGLPLRGHTWQDEKNWGYRSFEDRESLTNAYFALLQNLRPLIQSPGLSAAVYTQTTDVEIEVNGLMTYDRALIKMDAEHITAANRKMYLPPPLVRTTVPTSQDEGILWRYVTDTPADDWYKPTFDDSRWKTGQGGFGRKETPGSVVRTEWHTSDIYLRRIFTLPENVWLADPYLLIHHDEDAEVYINGALAAKAGGYTVSYGLLPMSKESREALRPGDNTLAAHCKQTSGGQCIDVGIVDVVERQPD